MANKNYKSVDETSIVQMEVDKSRFIAVACHIEGVTDVKSMVGSLKKSNKDAKHVAYAYRLNEDMSISRHNDDGEPSGSAGLPIFEVLKKHELTNTLIAVVRYFGGRELGKSKLTRTYGAVANEAIKNAKIFVTQFCNVYEMKVSYSDFAVLGKFFNEKGFYVIEQNAKDTTMPFLKVAIPQEDADKNLEAIKQRVRGASLITKVGTGYYRSKANIIAK